MEILLLVIVLLPLLTALGIKLIDRLINETLLNFLTINSALLSFTIASGMFFLLTVEKFEPIHFTFFTCSPILAPSSLFDAISTISIILFSKTAAPPRTMPRR